MIIWYGMIKIEYKGECKYVKYVTYYYLNIY